MSKYGVDEDVYFCGEWWIWEIKIESKLGYDLMDKLLDYIGDGDLLMKDDKIWIRRKVVDKFSKEVGINVERKDS